MAQNAGLNYPETPRREQKDNYHGIEIEDPYRWLEQSENPEVQDWVDRQNALTRSYLDSLPDRPLVEESLRKIWNYTKYSAPFRAAGAYYFFQKDGLENQAKLYRQSTPEGAAELVLDPNTFAEDATVSLAFTEPSADGRYLAYGLSSGGSDWVEIRVMDLESGTVLPDKLEWVKFSKAAWHGEGFYYSRYDAPANETKLTTKNKFHKVYYHRLGDEQGADTLIHEDRENPLRNFYVYVSDDRRYLVLSVHDSYGHGNKVLVRDLAQEQAPLVEIGENPNSSHVVLGSLNGRLLLFTNAEAARGRIVLVDLDKPEAGCWNEFIPEHTAAVIQTATMAGDKMLITYMQDVSARVVIYNLQGRAEGDIALPGHGAIVELSGKQGEDEVLYVFTSFAQPATIYRFDLQACRSYVFKAPNLKVSMANMETRQVFFTTKDGSRVPMFLTHRKGMVLDGSNPALLYGYGGFNVSLTPAFSTARLLFIEQGGVFASVNLRGGGEYGEEWHNAGMLERKQNVFDDFIAAAEFLIEQGYTNKAKLAMSGGSNGGLLVGAVMNQRPDLFRVAIPAVAVMDMLRYHRFTIGWAWVPEYGSSDEPAQFRTLLAYSPLHNIRAGTSYPATLLLTGDHDDRVVPAHSYKFAAELQHKAAPHNPALIRIEVRAGHGAGKPTDKMIKEQADMWAFVFHNLGMRFIPLQGGLE